jgi:hypothetical protein
MQKSAAWLSPGLTYAALLGHTLDSLIYSERGRGERGERTNKGQKRK